MNYTIDSQNIGYKIKQIREHKNMVQTELANNCEISINHIQKIEHGKRNASLSIILSICEHLDCAFGHIYTPTDFPMLDLTQNNLLSELNFEETLRFLSLLNTYTCETPNINTVLIHNIHCTAAEKIKAIRKFKHISKKELSNDCFICYDSLKNIESGNNSLTIDNLLKISTSLNVIADYFISNNLTDKSYIFHFILNNIFLNKINEEYLFTIETANEIKERLLKRRLLAYYNTKHL